VRLLEPPLTPGGDEARSLLRRELLHPDYHQDNLVLRLINWLTRLLDRGLAAARDTPPLTTFAAMLVGLLLVVAVIWLVSRARRSRRAPTVRPALLLDEHVSADELRARAEQALTEERYSDALVDAFRATALRQVERDRIDEMPGATAHEVAVALAEAFPERSAEVHRCAGLFDLVLYGGRPASRDQAAAVLALDAHLGGPVRAAAAS
jgi:Domain of unknown function (DUF4129)